jgi:hypothetical protein
MPILFQPFNWLQSRLFISSIDLAKKALRHEIDVTGVWSCSMSVSPIKARLYSSVVTYLTTIFYSTGVVDFQFILACPANF